MDARPKKMETQKVNVLKRSTGTSYQNPLKSEQFLHNGATKACFNKEDGQYVNQQQTNQIPSGDVVTIMHRQNEITTALLHQQRLLSLPARDIPVHDGDPLQYNAFIKAFEQGVRGQSQ